MPAKRVAQEPLKMLSDDNIALLHRECVTLLDRVGVRVDSEEALCLLSDYGVRCDPEEKRAHPDEQAIRNALASVGKSYTLHGRKPDAPSVVIDSHGTHLVSGGAALKLYSEGKYRDATREDLIAMTALHEKLDHIHILINVVEPPVMDQPTIYPAMAADMFCFSSKPLLLQVAGRTDLAKIIRMAALISEGEDELRKRPLFMTGINAEPPLKITREGAEVLIDAARAGIPVSLGSYFVAGATGPLHVAAGIVQRTATVLTGLVLTQAAAPGSCYDFSCHSGWCDLKTGDAITMSPDVMQIVAGSIQMGRHYGLPTHSLACTQAIAPDAQAAGERFFALTVSVMCGASVIHHATSCMGGMGLADFAQNVIDDEIAGYVLRFAAGIDMDGLGEALETVHQVVTDPAYDSLLFMGHPHTAANCRRQTLGAGLFAIGSLSRRLTENHASLYEQAEQIARDLLAERKEFVSPDVKKKLLQLAKE